MSEYEEKEALKIKRMIVRLNKCSTKRIMKDIYNERAYKSILKRIRDRAHSIKVINGNGFGDNRQEAEMQKDLKRLDNETVLDKKLYSAFEDGNLELAEKLYIENPEKLAKAVYSCFFIETLGVTSQYII